MRDGEFLLRLADDDLILRATPHSLRTLLTKYGGIKNALQKVYLIEEEIMFDTIMAGLAHSETPINKQVLRENIFLFGVINLVDPVTEFIMLLANGGKHPKTEDEIETENPSGKI